MTTVNCSFVIVIPPPAYPSSAVRHPRLTAVAHPPALVLHERARPQLAGGSFMLLRELALAVIIVAARVTQRWVPGGYPVGRSATDPDNAVAFSD